MQPDTITLKIGESGSQFLRRHHLPEKDHVDKQPAGLNFYEIDWNTKSPGKIVVDHGVHGFTIPHVLSVTGTENVDQMDAGLAQFDFRAGITAPDMVLHDEARQRFMGLLKELLSLGWKPFIAYEDPRLAGEQAFRYYLKDDNYYCIPPDYRPTLKQWMQIETGYWCLYVEKVFLEINFRRDSKRMNPKEPGAYLFSFSLSSAEKYSKSNFHGKKRERWKDLWVDKIKALKQERYAKEQTLKKRGFTIATDYEEPRIHPSDPVEP